MCGEGIRKKSGIDLCTATYIKLVNCRSLHRPSLKCSLINNCIATTEGKKTQDMRNNLLRWGVVYLELNVPLKKLNAELLSRTSFC